MSSVGLDALRYVRHPLGKYDTADKEDLHPSGVTAWGHKECSVVSKVTLDIFI